MELLCQHRECDRELFTASDRRLLCRVLRATGDGFCLYIHTYLLFAMVHRPSLTPYT